jgi:hypothetical protein
LWWSQIWKIKSPKKTKVLLCLGLKNRVLTWDRIQKGGKINLSLYYLYRESNEDIGHIMIHCSYVGQIWKDVDKFTGISNVWNGISIE